MAEIEISDLTAGTSLADADLFPFVDVSDTSQAASGTNKKATAAVARAGFGGHTINAKNYGAVGDGVTDDTAAIQAAIDAAELLGASMKDMTGNDTSTNYVGSGVVYLPGGKYLTGQLSLGNRVRLRGDGWGTVILKKNSTNAHHIINKTNALQCSVEWLRLEGNKANNTSGDGIRFVAPVASWNAALQESYDAHFVINRVLVKDYDGNGIYCNGRGETTLFDCFVWGCSEQGYNFDQDVHAVRCVAEWNGYEGFYIGSSGGTMTACKAFFNGQTTASRGAGIKVEGGNEWQITGVQVQDNLAQGLYILNAQNICVAGITADSNGSGVASTAGIDLNDAQGCNIDGVSIDLNRNATRQAYALDVRGTSYQNQIRLTATGNTAGQLKSLDAGNDVHINGARGSLQTPAFASSYTPDMQYGELHDVGALTGNITINAPTNAVKGQKLVLWLTQDGTGSRTATFNAVFHGVTAIGATASRHSIWEFWYDGSIWLQVAANVNIA